MVMGVSKTLRDAAGTIEGAPSQQIEAKLISSQHQELAALCLGVLLAPAFLLYVSFVEGVKTLIVLGFVLIFAGVVRVGMTLAYRSFGEGAGPTALSFWRPATILSVWFFSASLGAFAYIAITQTNDFRFHLVSIAIVGAYAAGTVGRNAAIQVGITGQLATTVLCVAIALFQRDDYIYKLLSLLVILYLMSLSAISRSVYDLIVSVLKATEEKAHLLDEITEKSERLDTALSNMPQGLAMFDEDWRIVVSNSQFQRILGFSCAESGNHGPSRKCWRASGAMEWFPRAFSIACPWRFSTRFVLRRRRRSSFRRWIIAFWKCRSSPRRGAVSWSLSPT